MRAGRVVFGFLLVGAACGSGGKDAATGPVGGGGDEVIRRDDSKGSDDMVPPEKMDEIRVRLDRRRGSVARCLSDAVLAGTAPRTARGKVTVEFVVSKAGRAEAVKVAKSTLELPAVHDCIIGKVKEIGFPELRRRLEWSYTYAFDTN